MSEIYNDQPVIGVTAAAEGETFADDLRVLGVDVLGADTDIHNDQPVLGAVLIGDGRTIYNNARVIPTTAISGVLA